MAVELGSDDLPNFFTDLADTNSLEEWVKRANIESSEKQNIESFLWEELLYGPEDDMQKDDTESTQWEESIYGLDYCMGVVETYENDLIDNIQKQVNIFEASHQSRKEHAIDSTVEKEKIERIQLEEFSNSLSMKTLRLETISVAHAYLAEQLKFEAKRIFNYMEENRNKNKVICRKCAPSVVSHLVNATPTQQRFLLGKTLYPLVQELEYEHAAKVTGMLLEMDQSEVLYLIESPDALEVKVYEAMDVLKNFNKAE